MKSTIGYKGPLMINVKEQLLYSWVDEITANAESHLGDLAGGDMSSGWHTTPTEVIQMTLPNVE